MAILIFLRILIILYRNISSAHDRLRTMMSRDICGTEKHKKMINCESFSFSVFRRVCVFASFGLIRQRSANVQLKLMII